MSIQVGDILRMVAQFAWDDGEIAQNVFNGVITGSGGPFDDGDILQDVGDWIDDMYAHVVGSMVPEINGSANILYIYDPIDDDWDEVGTVGWTFTGTTSSTVELPRGVAALVLGYTTDPDVQGKKYLPGFGEGAVVSGLFTSAVLTSMLNFLGEWAAPFVGAASSATFTPAIWSPTNTNAHVMNENGAANAIPAYQRRRKNNVGI